MDYEYSLSELRRFDDKTFLDALIHLDRLHAVVRFRKDGFHHIASIPEESYENVENEEEDD